MPRIISLISVAVKANRLFHGFIDKSCVPVKQIAKRGGSQTQSHYKFFKKTSDTGIHLDHTLCLRRGLNSEQPLWIRRLIGRFWESSIFSHLKRSFNSNSSIFINPVKKKLVPFYALVGFVSINNQQGSEDDIIGKSLVLDIKVGLILRHSQGSDCSLNI